MTDEFWPGHTSYDTGERECSVEGCEEITNRQIWDGSKWLAACDNHEAQVSMRIRMSDSLGGP